MKVPEQKFPIVRYFDYRHPWHIATLDIPPQIAVKKQWRYIGF
jgi:hypothetical protein